MMVELGKTEELEKDLLANVSHDLKTPLTMIKAYAEMIRDISYKDHDKMNEHLGIIVDETDRLTVLVNDILDLSNYHVLIVDDNDINIKLASRLLSQYKFKISTAKSGNMCLDLVKNNKYDID